MNLAYPLIRLSAYPLIFIIAILLTPKISAQQEVLCDHNEPISEYNSANGGFCFDVNHIYESIQPHNQIYY